MDSADHDVSLVSKLVSGVFWATLTFAFVSIGLGLLLVVERLVGAFPGLSPHPVLPLLIIAGGFVFGYVLAGRTATSPEREHQKKGTHTTFVVMFLVLSLALAVFMAAVSTPDVVAATLGFLSIIVVSLAGAYAMAFVVGTGRLKRRFIGG